jgi:hypothetical protein
VCASSPPTSKKKPEETSSLLFRRSPYKHRWSKISKQQQRLEEKEIAMKTKLRINTTGSHPACIFLLIKGKFWMEFIVSPAACLIPLRTVQPAQGCLQYKATRKLSREKK